MNKPYNDAMDSSGFVLLSDYIPQAIQEIRYFSTYNFIGRRIEGYDEPCALITKEAAIALKAVSDELYSQGYCLKIFDTYRPACAVHSFVKWGSDDKDDCMKEYFYPDFEKNQLFSKGFISEKSGHSRGSTVDLTLLDMKSGKELDMGGPFDYFGELSNTDYKGITEKQRENRMILQNAMIRHGFMPLDSEWWHFTLKNEPYPDTYFEFPVSSNYLKR